MTNNLLNINIYHISDKNTLNIKKCFCNISATIHVYLKA